MIRQVYRVKKDENLKKKDLAQDKEKLVIQEISARFVDQSVPNDKHVSEKQSCITIKFGWGQDRSKTVRAIETGLADLKISLGDFSGKKNEESFKLKSKVKTKPCWEELLSKYQ